jgi:hypothetical protein
MLYAQYKLRFDVHGVRLGACYGVDDPLQLTVEDNAKMEQAI